jgi:hypothetical protein
MRTEYWRGKMRCLMCWMPCHRQCFLVCHVEPVRAFPAQVAEFVCQCGRRSIRLYLTAGFPKFHPKAPLDGSARTLEDRQYVYQASTDVNGGTVTIGYPYSLLEWCAEPHSSWSLPVDVRRVPSTKTAQEVGAEQIKGLAESRAACLEALDILAVDGKYGNSGFLRSVKGLQNGTVARLRSDQVLCQASPACTGKRGCPRIHSKRFAYPIPGVTQMR